MRGSGGIVLLALGLIALFVGILFPYGRYGSSLARGLGSQLGADVQVGEMGPALSWGGPVLRASEVVVRLGDGRRLDVAELRVRPALSASWLRLDPALRVWAESSAGVVNGTLWLGESSAFQGRVADLDLETLGAESLAEGLALRGRADLEIDLQTASEGLLGRISLDARDGSLAFPPYGLPVPFTEARARIELDPASGVRIESFEVEDPGLSFTAQGTLGNRPSLEHGRLDVEGQVEVRNPGLRAVLAGGLPLDGQGRAPLRLQGTLARPLLR
ncbi:MAG: type II secretion system protein GspN [Myxococcota bacterium]